VFVRQPAAEIAKDRLDQREPGKNECRHGQTHKAKQAKALRVSPRQPSGQIDDLGSRVLKRGMNILAACQRCFQDLHALSCRSDSGEQLPLLAHSNVCAKRIHRLTEDVQESHIAFATPRDSIRPAVVCLPSGIRQREVSIAPSGLHAVCGVAFP